MKSKGLSGNAICTQHIDLAICEFCYMLYECCYFPTAPFSALVFSSKKETGFDSGSLS